MADDKPSQNIPEDESKKDTVRINLPPGLTGRTAAPAPGGPATVKLKPAPPTGPIEEEAKKETAVMGKRDAPSQVSTGEESKTETALLGRREAPSQVSTAGEDSKKETALMGKPVVAPKPKSDTSRVHVTGAKPAAPEMPRPTVKLRSTEAPTAAPPPVPGHAPTPAAAPLAPVMAAEPSGFEALVAVVSMFLAIVVTVYLVMLSGA